MKIALLTNEYPPNIYGGAGVHVEYLTRELAALGGGCEIKVLCFGEQNEISGNLRVLGVRDTGFLFPSKDQRHRRLFDVLLRNLIMTGSLDGADLIHCHTWYTHFAGYLIRELMGIPLVLTTHSLELSRPWKAEQLGTAYRISSWLEATALSEADGVIAVSEAMKADAQRLYGVPPEKISVIHNGIDVEEFSPSPDPEVLEGYGINPKKPYILFVGRITRQKGIIHFLNAVKYLRPGTQAVLCAGHPDTGEIEQEMRRLVGTLRQREGRGVFWIPEMLPKKRLASLYTHASVFVCPSIYEPFGIINLEAMACGVPVVASAVGGIPEVVSHGETGLLVPFEPLSPDNPEPRDPEGFAKALAEAANTLLDSPARMREMGRKARRRVESHFSWRAIAAKTMDFYKKFLKKI